MIISRDMPRGYDNIKAERDDLVRQLNELNAQKVNTSTSYGAFDPDASIEHGYRDARQWNMEDIASKMNRINQLRRSQQTYNRGNWDTDRELQGLEADMAQESGRQRFWDDYMKGVNADAAWWDDQMNQNVILSERTPPEGSQSFEGAGDRYRREPGRTYDPMPELHGYVPEGGQHLGSFSNRGVPALRGRGELRGIESEAVKHRRKKELEEIKHFGKERLTRKQMADIDIKLEAEYDDKYTDAMGNVVKNAPDLLEYKAERWRQLSGPMEGSGQGRATETQRIPPGADIIADIIQNRFMGSDEEKTQLAMEVIPFLESGDIEGAKNLLKKAIMAKNTGTTETGAYSPGVIERIRSRNPKPVYDLPGALRSRLKDKFKPDTNEERLQRSEWTRRVIPRSYR